MNLSGAFSYGNIIKTLIPGICVTLATLSLIDAYMFSFESRYVTFDFVSKYSVLSLGMLIPCSIFAGIISNSVCFSMIIPKYIEKPLKTKDVEFFKYKKDVINEMNSHYFELLQYDQEMRNSFDENFDVRSLLLNRKNLSNFQYLRESYWYYMEFQVNSILSIALLSLTALLHIFLNYWMGNLGGTYALLYVVFILLSNYILFKVFMRAARENYVKHEKKSLSYLQGAYHICRYGHSSQ
ncbi:TPA: hypothetical protein N2940_004528 [Vibrio parahaemolyticus]|uniref:hypothetical protein n=1 Tax=Vibrio parahaemolyticus TaxID=670 RepID=UPI00111FFB2E|nr:hypothetical protein [Vibrio parahaemolyticus]MBE3893067.1 hypothetical protein [Vibrio parahaemolyticus]TOD73688.1 hypothetical protein CGJ57_24315 [Vibrio parahaemolyticus]WLI84364.1 hypothetical protein Q7W79_15700 [Vibrio parahaemolyticus]HCG9621012.1 hypothetical protein [Vibrio parahaemolyticus]HCM1391573.1 hypothetical protein [Vibrio parahaemolyticus]